MRTKSRHRDSQEIEYVDAGGARLPEGTAPDVPPAPGTSAGAPKVEGIYRPDVGPGGKDIDEGDRPLPNRYRADR